MCRWLRLVLAGTFVAAASGCTHEVNPHQPENEDQVLTHVVQLTSGFDRAGEAYFSRDMHWIIFQAVPKGEKQYQMYVAPVQYALKDHPLPAGTVVRNTPLPGQIVIPKETDEIIGIGQPVRISPEVSRNTCGFFSPDGQTIIFGSTAGKEKPDEPTSGYQRQGGDYRWAYPDGMEIFRADGWQQAIEAAQPGTIVDLAKHPLTDNNVYDAECSFSPDGRWIVFSSKRTGDLELFAMRSDGSAVVQLTITPGYDGGPFFSPDGRKILYRSDRKNNNLLQVFTAELVFDGSGNITGIRNEKQLTNDANVNWGPFFSPDGRHILYATSAHGHTNYEIYLMRSDGSEKTRITRAAGADVLPVFSPDGKYMMWTSKRSTDNTSQVFVARFKYPRGS